MHYDSDYFWRYFYVWKIVFIRNDRNLGLYTRVRPNA